MIVQLVVIMSHKVEVTSSNFLFPFCANMSKKINEFGKTKGTSLILNNIFNL
jgi:hypothetical protein